MSRRAKLKVECGLLKIILDSIKLPIYFRHLQYHNYSCLIFLVYVIYDRDNHISSNVYVASIQAEPLSSVLLGLYTF